jgi:SNF2 family DNA or RNA helicase
MGENYLGYPVVLGPKNVDKLTKQLQGRFLKHTKEMVVKDLPPKIFVDVPLQMGDEQLRLYEDIRKSKDIEVETQKGTLVIPSALSKITRLQQAASLGLSIGPEFDVPSVKVDWTMEFIDDHPELSVVVFTRFVATAQRILDLLQEGGVQATGFFGPRTSFPIEFLNGEAKVLVATIAKAGEGLDLKRSHAAIFVDQEWSTIKMQQAYDRIHRLGIDSPKMLYMLKCSPIDYLIAEAIDKKWDDAQLVYEAVQRQMLNA